MKTKIFVSTVIAALLILCCVLPVGAAQRQDAQYTNPETSYQAIIIDDIDLLTESEEAKLIEEIDSLDPDDKHYIKRKADLDDRLYKMYDKIEDTESLLIEARAKKTAIEAEKLTADNIYKVLIYFDKLYAVMDEQERRQLMESLISEIHIFEERKPNGQWLKSIKFKLPIIEEDMEMSLDNDTQVETVCLLSRK